MGFNSGFKGLRNRQAVDRNEQKSFYACYPPVGQDIVVGIATC